MDRLNASYEVKLPAFEGPLDLLLHLIERAELDITTISLAQVTDQYLEYIRQLEERSAANLADFLVVATKLLLIKSRMLLPAPPVPLSEEEEDVGEGLVRQLIEYKRFKAVAAGLATREAEGLSSYVRVGGAVVVSGRSLDLSDVTLNGLVQLVRQALEVTLDSAPVSTVVAPLGVSIGEKIRLIQARLADQPEVDFGELIGGMHYRVEIIVTFLAVLEMIKSNTLVVQQDELFGRIVLRRKPEGQQPIEEPVEPGEAAEP
jgi:segregation and condensation protein A